jgi:hypothetical protein
MMMGSTATKRSLIALAVVIAVIVTVLIGYYRTSASSSSGGDASHLSIAYSADGGEVHATSLPAAASSASAGGAANAPVTADGKVASDAGGADVLSNVNIGSTAVIKVADLTLAAPNVMAAANSAISLATSVGGGVSADVRTAAIPDHPETATAELTLKVPPEQLDSTLNKIDGLGTERSRQTSSQDVTGQVADVNSRVSSAQASIARLQTLFARAGSVTDVVALENQLSQRQADLESLQAQQRALSSQTTFATITLHVISNDADATAMPKPKHHDNGFIAGLKSGWHSFTQALGWGLAGVGTILPFALLALLVLWIARVVRRRMTPPTAPTAPTD